MMRSWDLVLQHHWHWITVYRRCQPRQSTVIKHADIEVNREKHSVPHTLSVAHSRKIQTDHSFQNATKSNSTLLLVQQSAPLRQLIKNEKKKNILHTPCPTFQISSSAEKNAWPVTLGTKNRLTVETLKLHFPDIFFFLPHSLFLPLVECGKQCRGKQASEIYWPYSKSSVFLFLYLIKIHQNVWRESFFILSIDQL